MIAVRPVGSRRELDRFIAFPAILQAGDPAFVAPLRLERRDSLDPRKNPLFKHAAVRFFAAYRPDGRMAGRISAQADRRLGDLGQFGLLAAENDPAVFAALFQAAEGWLQARGRTRVQGPFDLSINEEVGALVDGFDRPPMLFMPHNPPWLGPRIEAEGYAKAKDLLAFLFDNAAPSPAWARRVRARPLPPGVTLRPLDWGRYEADLATVVDIFNDAWEQNWIFVPLGRDDLDALAKSLKLLIRRELVQIVEVRGEAAGFGVCVPNLNEAIRDLRGRLAPFGWAKLLWRLKVRGVRTARIPLMGVRRRFNGTPLGSRLPMILMSRLGEEALKVGIERIEMSWILEDNRGMRHFGEAMAGPPYKTYRVYEKRLAP